MKIDIPDHLYHSFLRFLDIAQSNFVQDEVSSFSLEEQDVIKFIEKLLGKSASKRFQNREEKYNMEKEFNEFMMNL